MHHNDTIDLLSSLTDENYRATNPTVVDIPNVSAFWAILKLAKSKSTNWKLQGYRNQDEFEYVPNHCHNFVRVALYNAQDERLSTLHVVDMVGSQSLTPKDMYQPLDREKEAERKIVNQQLLAFSRVVTELARIDSNDKGKFG